MNDDVLLHIFSNLNLLDLLAVAKCNRRFMLLAQKACVMSTLEQNDLTRTPNRRQSIEILNIFVDHIRHFNDKYFPRKIVKSAQLWKRLNVSQLKSLIIDLFTFEYIVKGPQTQRLVNRFENLEYFRPYGRFVPCAIELNDEYDEMTINFPKMMPKLKKMKMENGAKIRCAENQFPRTLESLVFAGDREMYESYVRLNPKLTRITLCAIVTIVDSEDLRNFTYDFYPSLSWGLLANTRNKHFQKTLADFIGLEHIKLVLDRAIGTDPGNFLMKFAKALPPQLKTLHCELYPNGYDAEWSTFVATMPVTCKCTKKNVA